MKDLDKIKKIEIEEFETSSKMQKYLAQFEDRHFEISDSIARLIIILQKTENLEEVANIFEGPNNKKYTLQQLEKIIKQYIIPILESPNTKKPHPLLFKIELIPENKIEFISKYLKLMFHKWIIITLIALTTIMEILFILYSPEFLELNHLNIYTALGIVGLTLLSSFVHEIGHASACKFYNASHGGVGFGLYLNFPVFYTDVSSIWKLPKKQRIIVNLAGVYFQLIMLIPIFLYYFATQSNITQYFIIIININLLFTLNPFFKYDGYWIVSDFLGVANLRKRSKELISYLFKIFFRRPIYEKPYLLLMKKREKFFMIIYSGIMSFFLGIYFLYIIPLFLTNFFNSFPQLMYQLVSTLSMGSNPDFQLIRNIFTQILFFTLIIFIFVRLFLLPLIKKLTSKKTL